MSDMCATVGCNHRRDEHPGSGPWETVDGAPRFEFGCYHYDPQWGYDECTAFAEQPTDEAYPGEDASMEDRFGGKGLSVAEHDDNPDLEAIQAFAKMWADENDPPARGEIVPAKTLVRASGYILAVLSVLDAERAKNTEALALLSELTDPDPCDWDHNHSCQAHGFYYIPQGEMCPNEQARILGGKD